MTDKEILIQKGKTFSLVVRWETEPIVRKAITAISLATGAPRLTISSHGITDGWNGTVYGVEGMKQINDVGVQQLTVIDSNTIELNGVTPIDDNGKMWSAYTSGGFVKFYTPKSLSGYTARMDIKDKIGGTVWASSEIADTPYDIIDIALDDVAKTITLTIDAVDTAALTAKKGVADLELVSSGGVVTKLKLTQGGQDETGNALLSNSAQMTPGFCYPPFHVETFPIGSCVMNRNDFNCLQFSGTPGAKFTNREAAEKIAADWNATYGN